MGRGIESFIFFRDWDFEKLEKALEELNKYGIGYIVMAGSKYTLPDIYENDEIAEEAREFIEMAYRKYGIKCIIYGWRGRKHKLFIDKEVAEKHAYIIINALKKIKDIKGIYGIYIDDEPYYTWEFSIDRIRDEYNDLFEEETGYRLPERGRVKGRWNYETAKKFCEWIGEKYIDYLKTVISKYKKFYPDIKSIIVLHIPAIFPSIDNPVDIYGVINAVDIVAHDVYPGWHQYPRVLDNIVAFETSFLRCLTNKPIWTILQGHKIMLGYAPTLEQIESWTMDAVNCGSDSIGWYAAEHDFMMGLWVKIDTKYTKYGCPERWRKMLEMCKRVNEIRGEKYSSDKAILVSYNSILSYGYLPLIYTYITLSRDAGIRIDFITEKNVERNPEILEKYSHIFLGYTPILKISTLNILKEYVEKGGLLIACCNDLWFNEKLEDLDIWRKKIFGVIEEKVFWRDDSISFEIFRLKNVKGFWERRMILKIDNSIKILGLWSNNTPAVILKNRGSGKAIYIGTQPYLANCIKGEGSWIKFFKMIIKLDEFI